MWLDIVLSLSFAYKLNVMKKLVPYMPFIGLSYMLKKYGREDVSLKDLSDSNEFWITGALHALYFVALIKLFQYVIF